jgi:hypothetical protein
MKPDRWTGTAPLCPNRSSSATWYSGQALSAKAVDCRMECRNVVKEQGTTNHPLPIMFWIISSILRSSVNQIICTET